MAQPKITTAEKLKVGNKFKIVKDAKGKKYRVIDLMQNSDKQITIAYLLGSAQKSMNISTEEEIELL